MIVVSVEIRQYVFFRTIRHVWIHFNFGYRGSQDVADTIRISRHDIVLPNIVPPLKLFSQSSLRTSGIDRCRIIVDANRRAGSIALTGKTRIRQNINHSPLLLLTRLVPSFGPVTTGGWLMNCSYCRRLCYVIWAQERIPSSQRRTFC
jgi:hypothetical protein